MMKTSLDKLKQAFDNDGYEVYDFSKDHHYDNIHKKDKRVSVLQGGGIQFNGRTGLMAVHRSETIQLGDTVRQKKAFYVEGSHYEMGFLVGAMAEPDVYHMANDYLNNVIPDFIGNEVSPKVKQIIVDLLEVLTSTSQVDHQDMPDIYIKEIKGLFDGCVAYKKSIGGGTKLILYPRLIALNLGIDILLAHVYTGVKLQKLGITADQLRVPIMCNAFSVKGSTVQENKHFFGRDFMFSTAGIFQNLACMIIYNPDYSDAIPTVSQTAPGFVGSITAMNLNGIAAGTDMNPTPMCSTSRPGFNSLGLVRDSVQYGGTMEGFIDRIKNAKRGVSWFYPGADGQSGRACFIETGKNIEDTPFPYFSYLSDAFKTALQSKGLNEQYIADKQIQYGNPAPVKGMLVRKSNYTYPVDYMTDFNSVLFDTYNTLHPKKQVPPYDAAKFGERGYINATNNTDKTKNYPGTLEANCPAACFFAPQREKCDDLLIVTNSNISPEMRLTAINEWITLLTGGDMNDIQWRYDELNDELLTSMDVAKAGGPLIDAMKAQQMIDFRAPGSTEYTVKFPKDDWQTIEINGSVSLCELKGKVIRSHYGYYGDPWVTITLPAYFD
ncbi:MAG: hypothetical protein HGA97_05040 [Chlorobiaceae bacterium]|nr:hypothetical protein [Chlorobiaceae bacterium]